MEVQIRGYTAFRINGLVPFFDNCSNVGRCGSVSETTGCRLEDKSSIPKRGRLLYLRYDLQTHLKAHTALVQWLSGIERPEREDDHLSPSINSFLLIL